MSQKADGDGDGLGLRPFKMSINSAEPCWSPSYRLLKSSLRGFPLLIPEGKTSYPSMRARLLLEAPIPAAGQRDRWVGGGTRMILSCQVLHKLKKSHNAVSLWVKAPRQLPGFANEHQLNLALQNMYFLMLSAGRSQSRCGHISSLSRHQ